MKSTSFIARRYLFSKKHVSLISTLTFISISGVTIGTALLIVVLSVFNGFFDVIKGFLLSFDPDIKIESSSSSTFTANAEVLENIRNLPEVRVISPYVEGKALLAYKDQGNKVVDVKGVVKEQFFQLIDIEESVTSGVFDISVRNNKPGIIIHEQLKNDLRIQLGQDLALISASGLRSALTQITAPRIYRFEPRGTYFLEQISQSPKVFVDLEAAQRLFKARNQYSGIDLKLNSNDEAEKVKVQLSEMLGDEYRISTWYDLQKPLYDVMNLEKWLAYVVLMIVVLVAILNIIGSLTMIVIQKKRDISILISMGYSISDIKSIFRKQGWYIGLIGCTLGGFIGFGLSFLQQKFGFIKLSSAFIIDSYPVMILWTDIAIILLGSLFLCVAASWYPAQRASQVQPADAVRFE